MKICVFWFRRDLRLYDNLGWIAACKSDYPVLPLFIFDNQILDELPKNDARVYFIYQQLKKINEQLSKKECSLLIKHGKPAKIWAELIKEYEIVKVHTNRDYEPYARERDQEIEGLLAKNDIAFQTYKDQVIFEPGEILKDNGDPYVVYTPYKDKWLDAFKYTRRFHPDDYKSAKKDLFEASFDFPSLTSIGFEKSEITVPDFDTSVIIDYHKHRDIPSVSGTSRMGPHLRFGTISVREAVQMGREQNDTFLSELIWREFFMQILYHFPRVVDQNFRRKYDGVAWKNDAKSFKKWCEGQTGYPIVDAGMRELNQTGFMHNRVRMIVASFLCKHLLIDWRKGEAYFAKHLLDYELAANNGNWQWAAGTGCDAAPYFRVFNPACQQERFDKDFKYIKKWVPEYDSDDYPEPMVDHKQARERALETYKTALDEA